MLPPPAALVCVFVDPVEPVGVGVVVVVVVVVPDDPGLVLVEPAVPEPVLPVLPAGAGLLVGVVADPLDPELVSEEPPVGAGEVLLPPDDPELLPSVVVGAGEEAVGPEVELPGVVLPESPVDAEPELEPEVEPELEPELEPEPDPEPPVVVPPPALVSVVGARGLSYTAVGTTGVVSW